MQSESEQIENRPPAEAHSPDVEGVIERLPSQREWLEKLADEFLKLERLFPSSFLPPGEYPGWVEHLEQEIADDIFPVAKIKNGLELTPRFFGALLGHQCALGVWLMEWVEANIDREPDTSELKQLHAKATEAGIERGAAFLRAIVWDWYPALRRLAKRALSSCVDRTYEEMTGFLLAYSQAFARKPGSLTPLDFGGTTFELYIFMFSYWSLVSRLDSVAHLHAVLVKTFGPYRVGELKRVEKICQRIGLHYRKPGRPKLAA